MYKTTHHPPPAFFNHKLFSSRDRNLLKNINKRITLGIFIYLIGIIALIISDNFIANNYQKLSSIANNAQSLTLLK
jgi:hypothetical protein